MAHMVNCWGYDKQKPTKWELMTCIIRDLKGNFGFHFKSIILLLDKVKEFHKSNFECKKYWIFLSWLTVKVQLWPLNALWLVSMGVNQVRLWQYQHVAFFFFFAKCCVFHKIIKFMCTTLRSTINPISSEKKIDFFYIFLRWNLISWIISICY